MGHHSIHVVDCSSVVDFAALVDQIEVAVVVAVGFHFAGFVAVVGFVDSDADYAVDLT